MLRIGLIGCGAIGRDHTRRINTLVPGAEVIAVSDYYRASAEGLAKQYGLKVYDTAEELIADSDVNAVVITSSDPSHAGDVLEGLRAGKWVFCEKPLAQNSADCEKILAEEQKQGKRFFRSGSCAATIRAMRK